MEMDFNKINYKNVLSLKKINIELINCHKNFLMVKNLNKISYILLNHRKFLFKPLNNILTEKIYFNEVIEINKHYKCIELYFKGYKIVFNLNSLNYLKVPKIKTQITEFKNIILLKFEKTCDIYNKKNLKKINFKEISKKQIINDYIESNKFFYLKINNKYWKIFSKKLNTEFKLKELKPKEYIANINIFKDYIIIFNNFKNCLIYNNNFKLKKINIPNKSDKITNFFAYTNYIKLQLNKIYYIIYDKNWKILDIKDKYGKLCKIFDFQPFKNFILIKFIKYYYFYDKDFKIINNTELNKTEKISNIKRYKKFIRLEINFEFDFFININSLKVYKYIDKTTIAFYDQLARLNKIYNYCSLDDILTKYDYLFDVESVYELNNYIIFIVFENIEPEKIIFYFNKNKLFKVNFKDKFENDIKQIYEIFNFLIIKYNDEYIIYNLKDNKKLEHFNY